MVREDRVIMSVKELRRVHVIRQTREQTLTPVKAGTLRGLRTRHIRRLIERVEPEGDQGLAHRGRGMPSNRRLPATVQAQALRRYAQRYGDVGPTLAAEKLAECPGSRSVLRPCGGGCERAGSSRSHGGSARTGCGGSGRRRWGSWCCCRARTMTGSRDAGPAVCGGPTSTMRPVGWMPGDGTLPAMDRCQHSVPPYGIPLAIDADKPTTSQAPASPSVEEQLAGVMPLSQCGRAVGELGVELLPAHSPQAKGRVERRVKTFQDRVIKEMRRADVSTPDAAHQLLQGSLPLDHRRFAVQSAQAADLHRPRPASRALDRSLCRTTTRCLRRDWTVAHHGHLSQVQTNIRATHVQVEERVEGTRRMTHHGRPLALHAITSRPMKAVEAKTVHRPRCPVTPRPDHPWRTRLRPERTSHAAAAGT